MGASRDDNVLVPAVTCPPECRQAVMDVARDWAAASGYRLEQKGGEVNYTKGGAVGAGRTISLTKADPVDGLSVVRVAGELTDRAMKVPLDGGGPTSPVLSEARAATLKDRQVLLDMICEQVSDATVIMQQTDLPAPAGLGAKVVGVIAFIVMAIIGWLVAQSLFN